MLLPPDLHDWIPADHMVHFIIDAVKALDLSLTHISSRSTGPAQYPHAMKLGPRIYCYANRTFTSRRIEILTLKKRGRALPHRRPPAPRRPHHPRRNQAPPRPPRQAPQNQTSHGGPCQRTPDRTTSSLSTKAHQPPSEGKFIIR